jgi:hypothetical protein
VQRVQPLTRQDVLCAQKHLPQLVQEIVDGVLSHMRAAGGLQPDLQRPLAVGLDGQVEELVEVVRGGQWVWLHGTGA